MPDAIPESEMASAPTPRRPSQFASCWETFHFRAAIGRRSTLSLKALFSDVQDAIS
jgi:hypothetical protein